MSDRSDEYGGENDVVFLGRRYSTSVDGKFSTGVERTF